MNYAKAVRIIRAATGFSQEEFAMRASINPSLISRIESGKRNPSKANINSISISFHVPLELIQILASESKSIASEKEKEKIGTKLLELLLSKNMEGKKSE